VTWYPLIVGLLPAGIGPNPIDGPGTPPGFDPNTVTPGVEGFIAIAVVAVAVMFLVVDMTRRIRRVRYRGEIREVLEAEQAMIAEGGPAEPEPEQPSER
jgi:hypothetical protein